MSRPELRVAHRMKGRTRLRVAGPPSDRAFWEKVERALSSSPTVRAVSVRPATGSIVVEHDGAIDEALRSAEDLVHLTPSEPAPGPHGNTATPLEHVAGAVEDASERMRRATRGDLDLRALAFYGLMGAGLLQIARGNVWSAAETLIFHALGLLPRRPPLR